MDGHEGTMEACLAHYAASTSEIRQRVTLRDQTLILYMTGVGAILALGLRKDAQPIVLAGVVLLGWGASMILRQHEQLVGMLREWCATEHHRELRSALGRDAPVPFELSATLLDPQFRAGESRHAGHLVSGRKWGYQMMLVGPQLLVCAYAVFFMASTSRDTLAIVQAGIVAILAAVSCVVTWRNVSDIARFRDRGVLRMRQARSDLVSDPPK